MIYFVYNNSDLSNIVASSGDTIFLMSNREYSASAIPSTLLSPDNITIGTYGSGDPAIITAGVIRKDWSYDAVNNVYFRPAYSTNCLGNVSEDGIPMKFISWNTNIATTSGNMVSGKNSDIWSGSMTFDPTNKIVYVRPSSGLAKDHEYVVSEEGSTNNCGIFSSSQSKNLNINDLIVSNISRHGILLYNKKNLVLNNVHARLIGGAKPSTLYMGNGFEISANCQSVKILNCKAENIFDSGFTSQLYEGSKSDISNHLYENNIVTRFGMHGVEVSVQTSNQSISNVFISGLIAEDEGTYSWAGDRNGAAVTFLSNSINLSRVTNCFAEKVIGNNLKRLYLGYQHGGICGIQHSVATNTWGQSQTVASNGATNQNDLWNNSYDNLGYPSGGSWKQVNCDFRNITSLVL